MKIIDIEIITKEIIQILKSRKMTISCAESCTGGRVASLLTAISGVSDVFWGGFVTYSNESKIKLLGVSPEILKEHGAVSGSCAAAMASGCLKISASNCAISVTGIAGPHGGTEEKPVGLVWFGIGVQGQVWTFQEHFTGHRDQIQQQASHRALGLLLKILQQEGVGES